MAQRKTQTVAIAVGGSSIAHGLTQNGVAATPNEITVVPTIAQGAGQTYRYSASDATCVYLAQGTSATSADVTAAVNHSLVS